MGKWSELTLDALQKLEHEVVLYYHNKKDFKARLTSRANSLFAKINLRFNCCPSFAELSRKRLLAAMSGHKWDILFSIQGKIDEATINTIRQRNPGIRIIYWWGDILTARGEEKIREIGRFVDLLPVSYKGIFDRFSGLGFENIHYLPFGVSSLHNVPEISPADNKKYAADVSFVGTCYPERSELIHYLNTKLAQPVTVWGRSWRQSKTVRSQGSLSMEETLKVYACSKISLNIHHHRTDNGFNMKFYEIPAANGFEICDWQPEIECQAAGKHMASYKDPDDLLEKIRFFLANESEREKRRNETREAVLKNDRYEDRFQKMFDRL